MSELSDSTTFFTKLLTDNVHGKAALHVASALANAGSFVDTAAFNDAELADITAQLHQANIIDDSGHQVSKVDAALQAMSRDELLGTCNDLLKQVDTAENVADTMYKKLEKQRAFYDGMKKQLLAAGHSLVDDMDEDEFLAYCVELLGGFVR